jgi:hypothetical protein
MPRRLTILALLLLVSIELFAQAPPALTPEQQQTVISAQKAAIQAMNFREGDLPGFTRNRDNFTAEGWSAFLKHMEGFLDDKGAPAFTSSFVPSHDAVVLKQENGILNFRIPGTLTQSTKQGKTTYRWFAIEVQVQGNPVKIVRLEQITCSNKSNTACQ